VKLNSRLIEASIGTKKLHSEIKMPDRIVSIDIETTGMHPESGDKIIEIGAIEMIDLNVTGNVFHQYINPYFPISDFLSSITGITTDFLSTQPHFSGVASNLVEFIAGSPLLSSNISFDMRFLNHELSGLGLGNLAQHGVIDLLKLSRKHFPGEPASLDYYVDKFDIKTEEIDAQGAIKDATITALVFKTCFSEIRNAER
jgi:DNA polymerase III subunit epsilon